MFTCKYCGVHYQVFHSMCPSCGAPYKEEALPKKTESQIIAEKVLKICDQYLNRDFSDNNDFKDGEAIYDKKINTISKAFCVFPIGKRIFLHCDTTPFRTGKWGFLVCEDGIYWQNSWTMPSNRNYLSWDNFKEREIVLKKFNLELGKGDAIGLAGLGTDAVRAVVAGFFQSIQKILKE